MEDLRIIETKQCYCIICGEWFHLGDPQFLEICDSYGIETGVCFVCWKKMGKSLSWFKKINRKEYEAN